MSGRLRSKRITSGALCLICSNASCSSSSYFRPVVRYLSRTSRIVVMLNGLSGSSDLAHYVEAMWLAEL